MRIPIRGTWKVGILVRFLIDGLILFRSEETIRRGREEEEEEEPGSAEC